ncbi:CMD domain protein [Inquilinus ginsengisoli]|uniref:CMD domain protein n=1 Tax=Inquilinus ginsengisoli TaxID=363840 RepID=A0ABU1JN75_9PROT|nr:CMD domain protein [Inquilinus ginsengisoli]MDR6289005.1 CMD domain protein [Inquilinus ginsengisoli]
MTAPTADVIDLLAGIEPGSRLDGIRAQRPAARENAQKSWLALFEPEIPGTVTALERRAVAAFVAALHREPAPAGFYADALAGQDGSAAIAAAIAAEAERGAATGPYGQYPAGPLSVEDVAGPVHRVADDSRRVLGPRLAAALEHTHLLVFRPRDASTAALQALLDAGWSTTDIVTLSQLVAFLSFQIRVVAGLRALAAA